MTIPAANPEEYITKVPEERRTSFIKLRQTILDNIPEGFEEAMSYGMIGYVVPKKLFAAGYHCDPRLPLPFASIASQKNSINFYHMGIYAKPDLLNWFVQEYPNHAKGKLDMGKSCVRFKKPDNIPYALIGELMQKMSVAEWIAVYESSFRK